MREKEQKESNAWVLEGLAAEEPLPTLRNKLMLFGQFVGRWEFSNHLFPQSHITKNKKGSGEIHFNWVLEGRAVQDIWGKRDPKSGKCLMRQIDPRIKARDGFSNITPVSFDWHAEEKQKGKWLVTEEMSVKRIS